MTMGYKRKLTNEEVKDLIKEKLTEPKNKVNEIEARSYDKSIMLDYDYNEPEYEEIEKE